MKKNIIAQVFACITCLAVSCTEDPPPTLLYRDREIIDSLFKMQVDSLRPQFDSLCEARFDSAVQHKVDSMIKEREAEREQYLERVRQEINQPNGN